MGGSDVFNSQGRTHNEAGSIHIDTCVHTHSPLPGHFALKRAKKLMRVQSFITLETERERQGERMGGSGSEGERETEREGEEVRKRKNEREREGGRERQRKGETEGNPLSSLCCGCHGNPHLTVGTDF